VSRGRRPGSRELKPSREDASRPRMCAYADENVTKAKYRFRISLRCLCQVRLVSVGLYIADMSADEPARVP